jgi:anti-anti-sigma regulatory factor
VLLSAKRTWAADGVPLSIVNCAPRMVEDLKLIGIDRMFVTGESPK